MSTYETFAATDGTTLAYRGLGDGDPVVCLPGGPMQDSRYLGDLGGLGARHRLVLLDLRGTGGSATPDDLSTCRCDRLVDDVEALRAHLGLDRVTLLGHSAGANLAVRYAAAHSGHVDRLVLVTPGLAAVGVDVSVAERRDVADLRAGEPWFAEASGALTAVAAGRGTAEDGAALAPFFHGRWDAAARAHDAARAGQTNDEAAAVYGAAGAYDPAVTRVALGTLAAPTLVLAGEYDVNTPPAAAARLAALLPHAELVVQPGAAHYPWLDDRERFVATVTGFIAP